MFSLSAKERMHINRTHELIPCLNTMLKSVINWMSRIEVRE